jgi:hypothetical protein
MRTIRRVAAVLAVAGLAGTALAAPASAHHRDPGGGSAFVGGLCGFWGPNYNFPGFTCPR